VFAEAYRPRPFRIARLAGCLVCQSWTTAAPSGDSAEALDVALDQALARLGDA
jgi:hypothetical protein